MASVNAFTVPNTGPTAGEVPLSLQVAVVLADASCNGVVLVELVRPAGMVDPEGDVFALEFLQPYGTDHAGNATGGAWVPLPDARLSDGRANVSVPVGGRGAALLRATRAPPGPFVPPAEYTELIVASCLPPGSGRRATLQRWIEAPGHSPGPNVTQLLLAATSSLDTAMCIDLNDCDVHAGDVEVYPCHRAGSQGCPGNETAFPTNQDWQVQLVDGGGGAVLLHSVVSDSYCVASNGAGQRLSTQPCNASNSAQLWNFVPDGADGSGPLTLQQLGQCGGHGASATAMQAACCVSVRETGTA